MVEHLVEHFESKNVRVAYMKRTHHLLDLPEKSSGRIWAKQPTAMLLRADDRLQITRQPGERESQWLLRQVPAGIDLVLLETHEPEPFPTLLARSLDPANDESVLKRWAFESISSDSTAAAQAVEALLPADKSLDHALRDAAAAHGGHVCAGLILGTRLGMYGASVLNVSIPDAEKRLVVTAEIDRCALDALAAVTGCRPGKRTLKLLDYGKLAATFLDQRTGTAVRVAAHGDLRARVGDDGPNRYETQKAAYLSWTNEELFSYRAVPAELPEFDRPGPPRRRVNCDACGEEVSDGRDVATASGTFCKPCFQGAAPD
jgi:formylmethanofuran dehydrogenase subunit E